MKVIEKFLIESTITELILGVIVFFLGGITILFGLLVGLVWIFG